MMSLDGPTSAEPADQAGAEENGARRRVDLMSEGKTAGGSRSHRPSSRLSVPLSLVGATVTFMIPVSPVGAIVTSAVLVSPVVATVTSTVPVSLVMRDHHVHGSLGHVA
jgi:hypothetical protein